jgi:redox-sensitive bicupin YhaK (pirin superfamily)
VPALRPSQDYYVFSAGSGGKHCELSIGPEEMNAIYLWLMPSQLFLPPAYHRAHFDLRTRRNRIVQLVGDADNALPVAQDLRVSRLVTDKAGPYTYTPRTSAHGVYVFVVDGKLTSNVADLGRRDSFGVSGIEEIKIEAADNTDVFFVETVMIDDAGITAWEKDHGEDVRH